MTPQITFVTGSPRSGTTLLTRLLGGMEGVNAYDQPLPLALVDIKSRFLRTRHAPPDHVAYPLADQQFSHGYPPDDFSSFVAETSLTSARIRRWLLEMSSYSGQYHRPSASETLLSSWGGGDLVDLVSAYARAHAPVPLGQVVWKETFAEEFTPYLLERGVNVVFLVRDVRDMIVSHVADGAEAHAGLPRPLLFLARQWRKTVAYVLAFQGRPDVAVIRMEDLVRSPTVCISGLRDQLWHDVDSLPDLSLQWTGNSSFTSHVGVSTSPIGRHRTHMTDQDRRFVEALCHSEMRAMGLVPSIDESDIDRCLDDGPANDNLQRPELASYAFTGDRVAEEHARRHALRRGVYDQSMFIFPAAYAALRLVQ